MSLIGTGQGLRRKAQTGFEAVARLENQRNMQQSAIDAQKKAQEMQLYGTGMGIGGAYGVNKALAAKDAAAVAAPKGVSASTAAANAPQGASGLQYVGGGLESLGPLSGPAPGAMETISGAAETAKLAGETSAAVAEALGTSSAAAGGGTAGGVAGGTSTVASGSGVGAASGAAGGASSTLGTIATIAGPIAIGLGAAFLLNKLFG